MDKTIVFVYGTLRNDYKGGMAAYLRENAKFIQPAHASGDMFMMGFPGVVPGEGVVKGDLFEVADQSVLDRLDGYEGHPHLFKRQKVEVTPTSAFPVLIEAWMYFYQGETARLQPIPDGDYLAVVAERHKN